MRIKRERLEEAEQEYEEDHQTFISFSTRLEEKWEQRFEMLARLARDAGVRSEDIKAVSGSDEHADHGAPRERATRILLVRAVKNCIALVEVAGLVKMSIFSSRAMARAKSSPPSDTLAKPPNGS